MILLYRVADRITHTPWHRPAPNLLSQATLEMVPRYPPVNVYDEDNDPWAERNLTPAAAGTGAQRPYTGAAGLYPAMRSGYPQCAVNHLPDFSSSGGWSCTVWEK